MLMDGGFAGEALLAVVASIDADMAIPAPSTPVRLARQERNARYYDGQRERLKASEKRLNKTSYETPPSPTPPTSTLPPLVPLRGTVPPFPNTHRPMPPASRSRPGSKKSGWPRRRRADNVPARPSCVERWSLPFAEEAPQRQSLQGCGPTTPRRMRPKATANSPRAFIGLSKMIVGPNGRQLCRFGRFRRRRGRMTAGSPPSIAGGWSTIGPPTSDPHPTTRQP